MQSFNPRMLRKACTACGKEFDSNSNFFECPDDGSLLAPVNEDPFIGTVLSEKYKIVELLGSGGWGSVYKGIHLTLNKGAAIKILQNHLVSDSLKVQRFESEARIASMLNHPNIVSVHDYGLIPLPFIVMDFVEGITLAEKLKSDEPIAPDIAAEIFLQLCLAMQAVHDAGLVHRDLKPSNVMLWQSEEGFYNVKLLDFGLSKKLALTGADSSDLTKTGETLGSPPYMSPEQYTGADVDARSDIYSMGCLMYETITGRRVFEAHSALEWLTKHVTETPEPFPYHLSKLPGVRLFESITLRTLEKAPEARYQSMQELHADLLLASQKRRPKRLKSAGLLHQMPIDSGALIRRKIIAVALITAAFVGIAGLMLFLNRAFFENLLWQNQYEEGLKLLAHQALPEAEQKIAAAVEISKQFGESDKRYISSQSKLLEVYQKQGKWTQATSLNEKLLILTGQRPSAEWQRISEKAVLLRDRFQFSQAEVEFLSAIKEAQKYGTENVPLSVSFEGLGNLYKLQKKLQMAESYCKRSLSIKQKLLSPLDIQIARNLKSLGEIYRQQNRVKEAIQVYLPAIQIVEKNLGPNHSDLSEYLTDLGVAYRNDFQYAKAEQCYLRALKVVEFGKGKNALDIAYINDDYAELLRQQGKVKEAISLLLKSIEIMELHNGKMFPDLDRPLYRLGLTYEQADQLQQAALCFKRAAEVRRRVAPQDPSVIENMNQARRLEQMMGRSKKNASRAD